MNYLYSVYVGGLEVNDYYMSLSQAQYLASQYDAEYDDVQIVNIDETDERCN